VRCLFEENLTTLTFPKIKEFVFKVNSNSPLEIAAKALATKNSHDKWKEYSFSHIDQNDKERRFEDLSTRFDVIATRTEKGSEVVLFYRAGKNMEKTSL
jgi:hypothetical protein